MTASTLFQFALAFLKLANFIIGKLHDRKMYNEGWQAATNAELAEIARRSPLVQAAVDRVKGMTDEEILAELDRTGGLRD